MEFASKGSLSGLLKSLKNIKREIPIETCRFFVAELVLALEYLNSKNICHRDLKPENILIDEDYHLKICDFGEAKIIKKLDKAQL
jgi:serine/threonine protein kinase